MPKKESLRKMLHNGMVDVLIGLRLVPVMRVQRLVAGGVSWAGSVSEGPRILVAP